MCPGQPGFKISSARGPAWAILSPPGPAALALISLMTDCDASHSLHISHKTDSGHHITLLQHGLTVSHPQPRAPTIQHFTLITIIITVIKYHLEIVFLTRNWINAPSQIFSYLGKGVRKIKIFSFSSVQCLNKRLDYAEVMFCKSLYFHNMSMS